MIQKKEHISLTLLMIQTMSNQIKTNTMHKFVSFQKPTKHKIIEWIRLKGPSGGHCTQPKLLNSSASWCLHRTIYVPFFVLCLLSWHLAPLKAWFHLVCTLPSAIYRYQWDSLWAFPSSGWTVPALSASPHEKCFSLFVILVVLWYQIRFKYTKFKYKE